MTALLDALIGPLGGLLAGIVAVAVAWLTGRRKGAADATQKREAQDARDYRETRERIDEALRRNDGVDDADWLRERGNKW